MSVYIFALGIKSANGLVKSTINTANSLVEKGVEVSIINIIGNRGGFEFLDPAFDLDSRVSTYSLDAISQYFAEPNLLNEVLHVEKQQFLKAQYNGCHKAALQDLNVSLSKNDLIIFAHPLAMVLFAKANSSTQATTLIQVHGNYLEETDNLKLLQEYVDYVDYIQTVSSLMKKDLEKVLDINPDKIVCIYNITKPILDYERLPSRYTRISIIGSIQKRKNQLDAIKALSLIEDKNIILQIYGNSLKNEYVEQLKFYIDLYKLNDCVVFKGVASEREIYENTDIAIMPSDHEGFGYIFLECALYGIPVIAYDFKYGAREFSQDNKNGCLISMGDYQNMAKVIESLAQDKIKYSEVVSINKKHFDAEYNEKSIVNNYLSLFKNIDKGRKWTYANDESDIVDYYSLQVNSIVRPKYKPWSDSFTEQEFYEISFTVKSVPKEICYIYKKSRFPLDLYVEDITEGIDKGRKLIKVNVPKFNRVSFNKPIKNFDILLKGEDNSQIIASIKDGVLPLLGIKKYMQQVHTGSICIKDIPHILKPNGFYIRYPSFESINTIKNEVGEKLKFSTHVFKYYGEELVFFRLDQGLYDKLFIKMNSGIELCIDFSEYSYKSVFRKIVDLENKLSFFDLKVMDIYIWELIRVPIFEHILEATGVLDKHFGKPSTTVNKYFGSKSILNIQDAKSKRLVFEFPRKSEADYRTLSIQRHFSQDSMILEYPQSYGYSKEAYSDDSSVFPIKDFLDTSAKYNPKIQYSDEDNNKIRWLKKVFLETFGVEIEFSLFIKSRLIKYMREYGYFSSYFDMHRFKEVLIPSAYWSPGIVSAAKEKGIITSDIQYAVISPYHPSFAINQPARAYGPDRVYLWSRYWNIEELTYNKSFILGTNYFTEKLKALSLNIKESNEYDVAFISQSRIGRKIFNFAIDFAKAYPTRSIIFCPHPDELLENYESFSEARLLDNFHINTACDTLHMINESNFVVGVYSTSLIESLALNKMTYVLKLSGYELYEREIQKGYLKLIESRSDLEKELEIGFSKNKSVDFMKLFYNQ